MCVNNKWIYNKYIKQSLLVPCGHCPSCLQEKANRRTARIRNNTSAGTICCFATLTYSWPCVPFILANDLRARRFPVPIYRLQDRYQVSVNGQLVERHKFNLHKIGEIDDVEDDYLTNIERQKLPLLRGTRYGRAVGVCFFKDAQDFIKRLRVNLERVYHYKEPFTYYISTEYGENYHRPHIHLLLFINKGDFELFRSAAVKSWQFADGTERGLSFEIARDAASYVASYVNCGTALPKVFKSRRLRPKYSYSKGFGMVLQSFSPVSIQEKVERGNLTYSVLRTEQGIGQVSNILVPKYVINRLFPHFKGYFRFDDNQIFDFILRPYKLCAFQRFLDCDAEQLRRIIVSLRNARERYMAKTGVSKEEYAFRYVRTWNVYRSTQFRQFMESQELMWPAYRLQEYDNISDLYQGLVHNYSLQESLQYLSLDEMPTDVNTFRRNVQKTLNLTDLFHKKLKTRKLNDLVRYETSV